MSDVLRLGPYAIHMRQAKLDYTGEVYVLASDYDALAAEVATLTAERDDAIARGVAGAEAWIVERDALKAQLAEITEQRDTAEANLARLQDRWDARPATGELEARLAEAERDAARYRWIHDNIDWIDGTGYVLNTLHPDADGCAMFQWGVDAAMADSAASQPHDNSGNVSVQANLASTLTSHPSLSPTHCCVDCGALWRQCDDFSMNLRSASCCDACNNAPVGPQIRPLYVAPKGNERE